MNLIFGLLFGLAVTAGSLAPAIASAADSATPKVASWRLISFSNSSESLAVGCKAPRELNWNTLKSNALYTELYFWNCSGTSDDSEILSLGIIQDTNRAPNSMLVVVDRKSVESSINLSAEAELLPQAILMATLKGLEPVYHLQVPLKDEKLFFGRVLYQEPFAVKCRKFVTTIAGIRNPLGERTMECEGTSPSGRRLNMKFKDENYWSRD